MEGGFRAEPRAEEIRAENMKHSTARHSGFSNTEEGQTPSRLQVEMGGMGTTNP